jgi:DNA modification methylase
MEIRKIPIEKLYPAAYNPRKDLQPGDPEYEKLKRSMQEFGYVEPIVWNKRTRNIVGGHQRYKVLLDTGAQEIDCVVVDLDETKEKALNIALNKISGDWDMPKLKDILQELDTGEFDLELTGFDMDEIEELMTQFHVPEEIVEDEVPEPPEEPITKPGDLWLLGRHRLLCGDATKKEDVERLMDGKKADMVFTDPPYGVEYTGGLQFKDGEVEKNNRQMIKNDESDDIYTEVIPVIASICNGPCYTWFADTKASKLYTAVEAVGDIHSLIIWVKNGGYGALNANYKQKHEPCLYWKPKGKKLNFVGATTETTIWEICKDGVNKLHPTQKPVELAAKAIKNHSAGLVVDLFGGSGSTLIACEQLNRTCYMMELDPVYCDVIVQRYINLKGHDGDVYLERDGNKIAFSNV